MIASSEKGQDFSCQSSEMGVESTLLTLNKLGDGDRPREALEELATMPSGSYPRADSEYSFVDGAQQALRSDCRAG